MKFITLVLGAMLLITFGCGGDGGGDTNTAVDSGNIDPALFVNRIDNPLFPLPPGTTYISGADTEDGQVRVEVQVTSETKLILGVTTTVVRAREFEDGALIEDTLDWFAQDINGTVWYFGEDSKEIEDGEVVSTAGSWEAGVNGARPGVVMFANPAVSPGLGVPYMQEFAPGVAEDMAEIVATDLNVEVPFGSFTGCLQTREFTPLEPGVSEFKFHCPGVGFVRATREDGTIKEELVAIE